jgi:hypothetical protein
MDHRIGGNEHGQRREHRKVAPVAPGKNLACDDGGEDDEKGEIDSRSKARPENGREGDGRASCDPEQHEAAERPALQRQTTGPVRYGREQKARNRRRDETEQ